MVQVSLNRSLVVPNNVSPFLRGGILTPTPILTLNLLIVLYFTHVRQQRTRKMKLTLKMLMTPQCFLNRDLAHCASFERLRKCKLDVQAGRKNTVVKRGSNRNWV